MDLTKPVIGIIAVFVCVLLTATIVVPVIGTYTDEKAVYKNVGMPYAYAEAEEDETHTLTLSSEGLTVDGVELDLSRLPSGFREYTLVYGENSFIRINIPNQNLRVCTSTFTQYTYDGGEVITMELTGSVMTISTTGTAASSTLSDVLYYISSDGEYTLTDNPHVNSTDVMVGGGSTNFPASTWSLPSPVNIYVIWSGTIDNIEGSILIIDNGYTNASIESIVVNSTEESAGGLYDVESVVLTFNITKNDTVYTVSSTYTYFIVPMVVEYDNVNQLDNSTYTALLMIIPVMMFIVCAIVAIRLISGRSD